MPNKKNNNMNYIIRKATSNDSEEIAKLLITAMEDIASYLFNTNNINDSIEILKQFISEDNNQYSWQNCWLVENDHKNIVAASNIYDGKNLIQLRRKILEYNLKNFNRELIIEDETQAGEMYIDCIGVSKDHQGKGIGTLLLKHLIETYAINNNTPLGLLVDFENPKAKELYISLGFKKTGEKSLAGKKLDHLQYYK